MIFCSKGKNGNWSHHVYVWTIGTFMLLYYDYSSGMLKIGLLVLDYIWLISLWCLLGSLHFIFTCSYLLVTSIVKFGWMHWQLLCADIPFRYLTLSVVHLVLCTRKEDSVKHFIQKMRVGESVNLVERLVERLLILQIFIPKINWWISRETIGDTLLRHADDILIQTSLPDGSLWVYCFIPCIYAVGFRWSNLHAMFKNEFHSGKRILLSFSSHSFGLSCPLCNDFPSGQDSSASWLP